MKSGRMRHKIAIQAATVSISDHGDAVQKWADVATVFADVRAVKASEDFISDKSFGRITHTIVTRFRDDVSSKNRIMWNGKTLNITSVLPDRRDHSMMLEAVENG